MANNSVNYIDDSRITGSPTHMGIPSDATNGTDSLVTIFQRVKSSPSFKSIKEFIQKAQKLQIGLPQLQEHLNLFETGKIISPKEKFKTLFFHAIKLGNSEKALEFFKSGQLEPAAVVTELLESEDASELALTLLCKEDVALTKDEATLPNLTTFLSLQIDINRLSFDGKSFYVMAIYSKNESLIQQTIRKGPRLSYDLLNDPLVKEYYVDKLKKTEGPPVLADVVDYHKSLGVTFNTNTSQLLKEAAKDDDPSLVQHFMSTDIDSEALRNQLTPLEIVLTENPNCLQVVEQLCKNGVDPSAPFSSKITPLHFACSKQNIPLATLLIKHGADVYAEHPIDQTIPLITLASQPAKEAKEVCKQEKFFKPEFFPKLAVHFHKHQARTSCAYVELVDYMATLLPKESFYTPEGMNLFAGMTRTCCQNALKTVMTKGVDLFVKQESGQSIFTFLLNQPNNFYVIAFLIVLNHINVNAKTAEGLPLIYWATERKDSQLTTFLIKKGAQTNIRGPHNKTLLHVACQNKMHEVIQALGGTNMIPLNELDEFQRPALYYALANDDTACINAMLQKGATPFFLDDRLVDFVRHILNNNLHHLINKTRLWQAFVSSKEADFIQFAAKTVTQYINEISELLFLIPQIPLTHSTKLLSSAKSILYILRHNRRQYPDAPIAYFYPFFFSIIEPTLQQKTASKSFILPECKASDTAATILSLFDELNWKNDEEPNYLDPDTVTLVGEPSQFGTLRSSLEKQLANKNDAPLFQNLAEALSKLPTSPQKTKYLLQLAWTAERQPDGVQSVALHIYQKLQTKKKNRELVVEQFLHELNEFRDLLVKKHGGNTPDFHLAYSARTIVPFAQKFLKRFLSIDDPMVASWFKKNIPAAYSCEEEREFRWTRTSLELMTKDAVQRQQALQKILEMKGYQTKRSLTPEEMLQRIRSKHFLKEKVFTPDGELKVEATLYFLQTLGIIQEITPGLFNQFKNRPTMEQTDTIEFEVQ